MNCKLCGSENLEEVMNLGDQPLANNLLSSANEGFEKYPLKMVFCRECKLGQLSEIVPSEKMFNKDYVFQAGVSTAWKNHCQKLVTETYRPSQTVVEIGCNDGTLLKEYRNNGMRIVGIDPAGVELGDGLAIKEFFTPEIARKVKENHKPSLVIAQNVLAHSPNLHEFMRSLEILCEETDAKVIIEVPYLINLLLDTHFDTIYHEHVYYFSQTSIVRLFDIYGFGIDRVNWFPIHGGSLRVYAHYGKNSERKRGRVESEGGQFDLKKLVERFKLDLRSVARLGKELKQLCKEHVFWGYGASAKATVFINYLDLSVSDIPLVIDDASSKQNKFIPCVDPIPIFPIDIFNTQKHPDAVLVFSWNNIDEIKMKLRKIGYKGTIFSRIGPYLVELE